MNVVTSPTRLKTRLKIIEASKSLFEENGITNTKIIEIAEIAGITRRTVYDHFQTKENIVNEVLYDYLSELYTFTLDFEINDNGFEKLSKLFHILFTRYFENMHIMRFLISYYQEYPKKTNYEEAIYKEITKSTNINRFKELYKEGILDGSVTCENPSEVGLVILQHVIGIPMRYSLRSNAFFGNQIRIPREKLHQSLDMLLNMYK